MTAGPRFARWGGVGAAIIFFLIGLTFIPLTGIQDDEALFAIGVYAPERALQSVAIGNTRIPIMLMSYVGADKSWLYNVLFHFFKPSLGCSRAHAADWRC